MQGGQDQRWTRSTASPSNGSVRMGIVNVRVTAIRHGPVEKVFRPNENGQVFVLYTSFVIVEDVSLIRSPDVGQIDFVEIVGVEQDGIAGVHEIAIVRRQAVGEPTSSLNEKLLSQSDFIISRFEIEIPE